MIKDFKSKNSDGRLIIQKCFFGLGFHNLNGITLFGLETDESFEVAIPYFMYQKLFKWHFDVHGLIEKGLAINLNDK